MQLHRRLIHLPVISPRMLPERASAAATVTAIDSMPKYIRTILELYAVCVRANGQKYAYRPTGRSMSTEACVGRFECGKTRINRCKQISEFPLLPNLKRFEPYEKQSNRISKCGGCG